MSRAIFARNISIADRTIKQEQSDDVDEAEERIRSIDFRLDGSLPVDKRRVATKASRKMMPCAETRSPSCYLTYAVNRVQYDPF